MSILEQFFCTYILCILGFITAQFSGVCLFQTCALDIVGVPIGVSLSLHFAVASMAEFWQVNRRIISLSQDTRRQPEDLMCVL